MPVEKFSKVNWAYIIFMLLVPCAMIFFFGVWSACNSATLHPEEGKGTAYPCGYWGVECSNKACCPYKHECGVEGDPWRRCEPGYCCYHGDDRYGSSRDGSAPEAGLYAPMSSVRAYTPPPHQPHR